MAWTGQRPVLATWGGWWGGEGLVGVCVYVCVCGVGWVGGGGGGEGAGARVGR